MTSTVGDFPLRKDRMAHVKRYRRIPSVNPAICGEVSPSENVRPRARMEVENERR
jgi:hypothetical protein